MATLALASLFGTAEQGRVERPAARTSRVLDATFIARGSPAFAYRAYRAEDGRSLTVVSVDATSRAALSTVVVYDRE